MSNPVKMAEKVENDIKKNTANLILPYLPHIMALIFLAGMAYASLLKTNQLDDKVTNLQIQVAVMQQNTNDLKSGYLRMETRVDSRRCA